MKKTLFICGVIMLKLAAPAGASLVINNNWTVNAAIPDGNPVGITTSQTFQNLTGNPITDVTVALNISGGYNGDLVGYLTLQDAYGNLATEILLNRIGATPANSFGSSGSGFNVTLSDSGTANGSIHNATGIPTGIWLPDAAKTMDGTFGGLTANGTWTLYLADLSVGGGTSTLNSWGLDVNVSSIPEPAGTGLISGMGALLIMTTSALVQHQRRKSKLTI
jgi:subtilisin-like proprotein convertase family protein